MAKLTIKQKLFDILNIVGSEDKEWKKKDLVKILDNIRGVYPYCQYQYSFDDGTKRHKPGYLRSPSKSCPYYLERVRRGVYRVVNDSEIGNLDAYAKLGCWVHEFFNSQINN